MDAQPTRLSAITRWLMVLLRRWPLPRGRHRLERLFAPFVTIPEQATFAFDYGTFVDTPLAAWPNGYRELLLHGSMEREELAVWRQLIRPGDAVVDGGANYGYWTLVASKLTGPAGRVFSFEANPMTAGKLSANVAASHRGNVSVYPFALGAEEGTAEIHAAADNPIAGHASLHRHEGWQWSDSVKVRLARMDDVSAAEHWPRIRLIKLDIEGAELSALRGMEAILRRDRPYLTVEWNVSAAEGFGYHPRETVAFLRQLEFALVQPTGSGFVAAQTPREADVAMMWFSHHQPITRTL
jgi:FkbM family methyltransferase